MFEVLKVALIDIVAILMISAKLATLELLKINVFWNKGYDVIVSVHDVTNKILSHDSNYIVDVFMWPKFGNFSVSMKERSFITSILWGFDHKTIWTGQPLLNCLEGYKILLFCINYSRRIKVVFGEIITDKLFLPHYGNVL